MTTQNELDQLLATWLADEAPWREPEGLLQRTLLHVESVRSLPAWLTVVRGTSMGRTAAPIPRLVLVLALMALLVIALLGGEIGRAHV